MKLMLINIMPIEYQPLFLVQSTIRLLIDTIIALSEVVRHQLVVSQTVTALHLLTPYDLVCGYIHE